MTVKDISPEEKEQFNSFVTHPLQSYEWGEFRKKTGIKVIRKAFFENDKLVNGFQVTIHKIPKTSFTIGYLPKGNVPTVELITELEKTGKEQKCIFIQLEPNVIGNLKLEIGNLKLIPSAHPLFTKYTFILDLAKSEEELLKNMHPKTRYNIKVAQKHEVVVEEDNSNEAFKQYLKLTRETTKRQGFYAHSEQYHRLQWETLPHKIINHKSSIINQLTSHLLLAKYQGKALVAWIVFIFKDTLYYPYGASSLEHRELMASNLMMWEAITFGKKLGLKKFDMWGALGPDPNPKDPWFGFHRFKQGFGPKLVEFVGSFDLVLAPTLYTLYKGVDKLRWSFLKFTKR